MKNKIRLLLKGWDDFKEFKNAYVLYIPSGLIVLGMNMIKESDVWTDETLGDMGRTFKNIVIFPMDSIDFMEVEKTE